MHTQGIVRFYHITHWFIFLGQCFFYHYCGSVWFIWYQKEGGGKGNFFYLVYGHSLWNCIVLVRRSNQLSVPCPFSFLFPHRHNFALWHVNHTHLQPKWWMNSWFWPMWPPQTLNQMMDNDSWRSENSKEENESMQKHIFLHFDRILFVMTMRRKIYMCDRNTASSNSFSPDFGRKNTRVWQEI